MSESHEKEKVFPRQRLMTKSVSNNKTTVVVVDGVVVAFVVIEIYWGRGR